MEDHGLFSAVLSWIVSIVLSFLAIAIPTGLVSSYAGVTSGRVAAVVLLVLVIAWWVWASRRYGRVPPIRLFQ